nr:hypothetical protein Itr_chr14CG29060 [Ipomoea trifida]
MPMRRVVTRVIAARSRSPRWPANDWVMTVRENMARRLKMVGPATCQIFFDSAHVCFTSESLPDGGRRPLVSAAVVHLSTGPELADDEEDEVQSSLVGQTGQPVE